MIQDGVNLIKNALTSKSKVTEGYEKLVDKAFRTNSSQLLYHHHIFNYDKPKQIEIKKGETK